MDRQTIMYAGSVTARMLVAQQAVHFIKIIAGKEAFCMCLSVPFYVSPDVSFAVPSTASRSRTKSLGHAKSLSVTYEVSRSRKKSLGHVQSLSVTQKVSLSRTKSLGHVKSLSVTYKVSQSRTKSLGHIEIRELII
jgi:hypothetical protein